MFAVLDLPVFPLQAITRLEAAGARPELPAVVTEASGRHSKVIAVNPIAGSFLIETGMSLAQARSRADQLRAYHRRPAAEAAAMDLLFSLAYLHTPRIERTGLGILTLDLKGLRRTDWTAFALELIEAASCHGLTLRIGFAPLPDLALFAARTATEGQPVRHAELETASLAGLPFAATCISAALQNLLGTMGLRHLGDFLALPRAEVSRRLGEEALRLWDGASGAHIRLLQVAVPLTRFHVAQELEYKVETLEPLLFLLRRFLDQIEAQLRAATQYASHLWLTLQVDQAPPYTRSFKLPEPTQHGRLLFRILHLHLEQLRTERAIVGVELEVTPVNPSPRQRGLFHAALKDPWRFTDTQSQLLGLVGPDRVGRPILLNTHQPGRFRLEPLLEEVGPLPDLSPDAAAGLRSGPPIRRYSPPISAQVRLRENRPAQLDSSLFQGLIDQSHGPFLLSGDWWQKDTAWHQAEWDVTLVDGTALRLRYSRAGWQIEGLYD